MLAEVVLLMRGPFVAKPYIFLLHFAFPPGLLSTFGRNIVLRRWLVVHHCVGGCTIAVARAKGGARLRLPGRVFILLPQHAAQGTVPQRVLKISGGPRSVRTPTPSAEVQVFAGLVGWRGGRLTIGGFRVEECRVQHIIQVNCLGRKFRGRCKLRRR
jgi:hypothetical protein